MTRRVLMVAYFFPPVGGVAMPRTMAPVRYLPRHGWTPVVLTSKDPGFHLLDEAAIGRIPAGTVVVRSRIIEPGHLRRVLLPDGPAGPAEVAVETTSQVGLSRRLAQRAATRWRRILGSLSRLVSFPDEQVGWLPFGIVSGLRAARRERADVIWSTSSPITAHLIAGSLATVGRRPWVADFRDPWLGTGLEFKRPRIQRWLTARLEAWIVRRADRVTFATPRLTRQYADRYPAFASKFTTWFNGYDRAELDELMAARGAQAREREPGPFRLVHSGSIYRPREFATLLDGVALAIRRGSLRPGQVRIEFIGHVISECLALMNEWSRAPGHEGILHRHGFLPRSEALSTLAGADAALVIMGDDPGMDLNIPVKVFEAIGLDRLVLAMAPIGDLRDVLEGLDWGIIVDPKPEAVADGLVRLVSSPTEPRRVDSDGRYDRASLAGDLALILTDVCDRRHRSDSGGRD